MTTTAGVKFPPPAIFAIGLALGWLLDLALPLVAPPEGRFLWGAPLLLAGILLDVWAVMTMRRARTTILPWGSASALVVRGPFRVTRNPIYLGYTLEYAAIALWIGTLWGWILLVPVLVAMDRAVIAREERHLAATFGADYDAYRARVRRWI